MEDKNECGALPQEKFVKRANQSFSKVSCSVATFLVLIVQQTVK
jgi:hypothetical protein